MSDLTQSSVRVLHAVEALCARDASATVSSVRMAAGCGETTAKEQLRKLEERGFLNRERWLGKATTWTVHDKHNDQEEDVTEAETKRRQRRTRVEIEERDTRVLGLLATGRYTRTMVATMLGIEETDAYWALRKHLLDGTVTKYRDGTRTPLWGMRE